MSTTITNIFGAIPKHPKSHTRGWATHWQQFLDCPIGPITPDTTKIYHDKGINSAPNTLNVFGGINQDFVDRLTLLADLEPEIVALDAPLDAAIIHGLLEKRIGLLSTVPTLTPALCAKVAQVLSQSTTLTQQDLVQDHVSIGDSHTPAFTAPNTPCIPHNGLLLYSWLRAPWPAVPSVKTLQITLGSIDIRHHLTRRSDPQDAAISLAADLIRTVQTIETTHGIEIV